jgi:serine/threonine-protein kinase
MVGRTVSRYTILERLGKGAMGVVYKARDLRLERLVALKFLVTDRLENESARQRFMQEAKAASALDHPNICTIYSIEDTDEGETFISMAYYEGETLQHRIERGVIGVNEALEIAIQIGRGLARAHEHGIVHRDVKPANVMLTPDGTVKLLDFGIAILGGSIRSTLPGIAVGTPAYMSPEQARSEECDARTDIWALGVVLYMMLTGQWPFRGHQQHALVHSILNDPPRPVGELRTGAPASLDRIIGRALAKDPDQRYRSAKEFINALTLVLETVPIGENAETVQEPSAAALHETPAAIRTAPSIAVLPFANLSHDPENEYFSDGISEEIITALAQVEGLRVVSRTSAFQFKGKTGDVREIGQSLRVVSVLEGSVRIAGDRVRVAVQLVNVADGYQVWSQRFDRRMEDIFAIQDEIAQSIVSALRIKLATGASQTAQVAPRPRPDNMAAYTLYLKGRYQWNKQTEEGLRSAAQYFEEAIAEDPQYAPAWAGLADYNIALGFWSVMPPDELWPKARKHALRAVELDPSLPHAQISMGYVRVFCDWNWTEAGRHFQTAVELSPGDSQARYAHAVYLTQMSRVDEALIEMRHALSLDPLALNVNTALALVYYYRREYDRATDLAQKTLQLDPNHFEMQVGLACIRLQTSRFEEGVQALEALSAASGDNPIILGLLGYGYGVAGMDSKAHDIIDKLELLSKERYVAPISRALVHIGLAAHDEAFAWLDRAAAAHDVLLCYLDVMPCYDPLRRDARFRALRQKIGMLARATQGS